MGFPWLLALKVIPWGDVIEHAPKVLKGARRLLDKNWQAPDAPPPADPLASVEGEDARWAALKVEYRRLQNDLTELAQTCADLAEQNSKLVNAVEVLRWRTRWLGGACLVLTAAVLALFLTGS